MTDAGSAEPAALTVVTVVRDDVDGLRRTTESVARQRRVSIEHVVVDGRSTDGTLELARSLAADGSVRLREGSDQGIYEAMNDGLADCTGAVVHFLNAGDEYLADDAAAFAVARLDAARASWGCGPVAVVDAEGAPGGVLGGHPFELGGQLSARGGAHHPGVFMRTGFLRALGGFDPTYRIAADWLCITRAALVEEPVWWDRQLVRFRNDGVSYRRFRAAALDAHQARVVLLGGGMGLRTASRIQAELRLLPVELRVQGLRAAEAVHPGLAAGLRQVRRRQRGTS